MTRPVDLTTLNLCSELAKKALQTSVQNFEQQALDAGKRGEYHSAELYKQWAWAQDLAVHTVSNALFALFCEASERGDFEVKPELRLVEKTEFPSLTRSEEAQRLDDLQVELNSAQPEPEPA